jgi:riboflavin kinase/FMN adenylyltransferase
LERRLAWPEIAGFLEDSAHQSCSSELGAAVIILEGLESVSSIFEATVVTVGNFDGVHLGHVRLLRRTVELARQWGIAAVAFTFDPHPAAILQPQNPPLPLTDRERKLDLLRPLGLDAVILYPTDYEFLSLTWRDFLEELLLGKLRVRGVVEGPDFRFGRNREGDWHLLQTWAKERGIYAELVPAVVVEGQPISSSRIRALIAAGDVSTANRLLSEPFRIRGRVVVGAKRGRTLGYPTANLADVKTILPAQGIYAGRAYLAEQAAVYPAAISIGPNPTFEEMGLKIEAYLLDFEGDLYGKIIELEFLARLRDVQRFDNVQTLIEQMHRDVIATREITGCPLPIRS